MLLPILALMQLATPPGGAAPPPTYHGGQGELEVATPRLDEEELRVDGVLDEPAWLHAALLTGFSQYSPADGLPARDSTEVLVWYSIDAIHFGIRAFEPHAAVNARLADRDRIQNDDYVQILLDTFDDARQALVFAVNPFGVQSDGVRTEGSGGGGGGFSAAPREDAVDLSPDFLYESAGRLTEYGYEIELRIPFESIRFQPEEAQSWGINIIRTVQHSGHEQTWTPARRGRASFLAQSGHLRELRGLDRGLVLDVNPVATARMDGTPSATGWEYGGVSPEFGANVRWGVTPNLTLNGTVNPDFSQVEADAGQVSYDPRRALFFPEKRPFFLEGIAQFDTPNRLVHTRRIVSPVAAAKVTGKVSGTEIGLLSAVDDAALSPTGDHPVFNILRVRRDVGTGSTVGVVYTDRVEGSAYNRVAGADARLVFGEVYTLALQGAASFTGTDAGGESAPLWDLDFRREGRRFGLSYNFTGMSPGFVAASGFLSRVGLVDMRFSPRITVFGEPGATLESWSGAVVLSGNWLYDNFFGNGPSEDLKLHLNNSLALRGGWRLGASLLLESFGFPHYLYADYAVERTTRAGTDTVPFVGTPRIGNLDLVVNIATPQFERFGGNVMMIVGRDENFEEWAPAYILIMDGGLDWRPTEQIRAHASYVRQQYVRPGDRTTVAVRQIPRLKLEYQLTRSIFLRFVGQYDARFRDALRDDARTDDPILIRDPVTGVFERAPEQQTNAFRADWLFSYQPNPGTVIFAGYGTGLTEPEAFRFGDMRRTSDGFFLKVSYLFRL